MNEIIRCNRCNKVLINEEFNTHVCSPVIINSQKKEFDYYIIRKDKKGKTTILIKDMDGCVYIFVQNVDSKVFSYPNTQKSTPILNTRRINRT